MAHWVSVHVFVRTLSSRFLSGFPENGDSQNTAPNMDIDPKTGLLFALRESDCADIRAPLDSQRSLLPFAFTSSSIEVRGPKLGIVSEMQVLCGNTAETSSYNKESTVRTA